MGPESGLQGAPPVSLFEDSKRNLWATNPNSIFELAKGANKFPQPASQTYWVMDMVESANGAIWMAETAGKVRRMSPAGGPRIDYGSQKIMFDREGSLWITTLGDGLRRVLDPGDLPAATIEKSSRLLDSFTAKDGLTSDYVTSIYQDHEGNIFVGTAGGLPSKDTRYLIGVLCWPGPSIQAIVS
jgi:ligand-binding sensor domain-containing protein